MLTALFIAGVVGAITIPFLWFFAHNRKPKQPLSQNGGDLTIQAQPANPNRNGGNLSIRGQTTSTSLQIRTEVRGGIPTEEFNQALMERLRETVRQAGLNLDELRTNLRTSQQRVERDYLRGGGWRVRMTLGEPEPKEPPKVSGPEKQEPPAPKLSPTIYDRLNSDDED